MLVEITIKEFAIIENLKINFNDGLNILTGETGAGKSIIIDAIQLIIGGRGSVDFIRSRADKSEIEAMFDLDYNHSVYSLLDENEVEYSKEEMLIITRELFRNGKSVCRINGQVVNLALLKEVGAKIVQLYSQLQHQQLLHNEKQLTLLDGFAEDKLAEIKVAYSEKYQRYVMLKKNLMLLLDDERETAQRLDLLKYQISEIKAASLNLNEEDELNYQKNMINYAEKIATSLNIAHENLSKEHGALDLVGVSLVQLEQLIEYDEKFKVLHEEMTNAFYQLDELAHEVAGRLNNIEFDASQLDQIEERLSAIYFLKRKYGDSIESILEYLEKSLIELDYLENREVHLEQLKQDLNTATADMLTDAITLSKERSKAAQELARLIEIELADLQMNNTRMEIALEHIEDSAGVEYKGTKYQITKNGLDQVEFLISPNPGEPLKPLNKIASGGELSRIMLATLTILAEKEEVPTIIFDEIDTGVSGKAAQAIAEKLAKVSKSKQVFAITHLSQVAAMADSHYLIQKDTDEMITKTKINQLNRDERESVLARMLGGVEITDTTYRHARELIEKAQLFKEKI
jgi:DNA repair protein RecN (Recombination protein N)